MPRSKLYVLGKVFHPSVSVLYHDSPPSTAAAPPAAFDPSLDLTAAFSSTYQACVSAAG